ncbi:MAG: LacI family DNA-binding transcriptional regulator [Marinovum algicola]|jgi:DNA-binding LacI/PurR family transcriptional regulator|uniref:Transcriptional regulator, LacI family n=1 Tax=Marinovum algicola TaxID=42444 RepID=A0A975WFI1_9RHOB|nr:transcriptional regulator, LacI family [Marinovum algicola]SLN76375.1 HTH-type transcriptional regulator DegA [Marinovum algicola]
MAGIKDVAKRAGVSVSTVSNVINGRHAKMGARTLRRVQEAIDDLSYTPNAVARQLKSGQIKTLGLVVPSVANPFWGNASQLIEKAALKRGYQVLICNAEREPELEATYFSSLYASSIRGTILGSSPVSFDHLREHARNGMHIGAFDRTTQGAEGVVTCSVSVDQSLGARLATRHLIGLGHRRIGFISGPIGTSSRTARLEGMRQELEKAGLTPDPDLVWLATNATGFGDSQAAELGRTGIRELLTLDDPPTAVFTVNDMYAIGACSGARELGFRVPEDLSVVGFDDIIMAKVMEPPLTTIRQPVEQMAELIVKKLIATLEGTETTDDAHVVLRPELIVRSSTAAPPAPNAQEKD